MGSIKRWLIQYLVRHLLAAITEKDILTVTSRGWYSDNRRLTAEEIEALRNDAQSFKDSVLYNYIRNELRYLANLKMFEHGIKEENTVFGRAMLYNLEVIEKFIKGISKI